MIAIKTDRLTERAAMIHRFIQRAFLLVLAVSLAFGSLQAAARRVYPGNTNLPPAGGPPFDGLTWATAFTNITEALAVATSGDEVWVTKGAYNEALQLPAGVALYGGFNAKEASRSARSFLTNVTTLDGSDSPNSIITVAVGTDPTTRVDGFTFRHSTGLLGAGIAATNSSLTVENNLFLRLGTNLTLGGALYIEFGEPRILANRFEGNVAFLGGAIAVHQSSPLIKGNTFERNTGEKASALAFDLCTGTVEANLFLGNVSAQASTVGLVFSSMEFARNRFIANHSGGQGSTGLGCSSGGLVLVHNNLFALGNARTGRIDAGSAIDVAAGVAALIWNNTFMDNDSHVFGLPAVAAPAGAEVVNNLFIREEWALFVPTNAVGDIRNNCFFRCAYPWGSAINLIGLNGNFSADPKLGAEPPQFQPRLRPDSPCRHAGEIGTLVGELDLDGQRRVVDGRVDVGAFQSNGSTPAPPPVQRLHVSSKGLRISNGTSWSKAVNSFATAFALTGPDVDTEIWVEAGTWAEAISVPPFTRLYGGFAGNEDSITNRDWQARITLIDARNRTNAVQFDGTGPFSVLDGFNITRGAGAKGGGIYGYAASPWVVNNVIYNNVADTQSVTRSGFGGGLCFEFGGPTISNNVISDNTAKLGGGIFISTLASARAVIVNNRIERNVIDPTLSLEHKLGGGGVYVDGYAIIDNNLIAENSARLPRAGSTVPVTGAGVFIVSVGPSTIRHNNILRNRFQPAQNRTVSGAGIHAEGTGLIVANNLVAYNSTGIDLLGAAFPAVRANLLFGHAGNDFNTAEYHSMNLFADPRMLDSLNVEAHSPCIDAADGSLTDLFETDILGHSRWVGAAPDIGALEAVPDALLSNPVARLLLYTPLTFHTSDEVSYATYDLGCLPCGASTNSPRVTPVDGSWQANFLFQPPPTGVDCTNGCISAPGTAVLGFLPSGVHSLLLTENGAPVIRLPFIVPPSPAHLLELTNIADQVFLHGRFAPGLSYRVQSSTNLFDWKTLREVSAVNPAGFNRLLPSPGNFHQFFRVALPAQSED